MYVLSMLYTVTKTTKYIIQTRILYYILQITFGVVHGLFHTFLAVVYYGQKKVVPGIKNPLLLKSATSLAEDIREDRVKCVEVIKAYSDRIAEVEPYINATVDRCFLDAMVEARKVDALIASEQYTKYQLAVEKPLLGVPISVKILLKVKGLRCTAGSLLFKNYISEEDARSVALLKKAGAIVIATTNSPEAGMNVETVNLVHGRTRNPYDTTRTSGGSSGGESALIAAGGSVLGLGNDMAGSIRLPCHFTGLFGHKPTGGTVSNHGCFPVPHPKIQSFVCTGPMCRYAEDLNISMALLTEDEELRLKYSRSVDFTKLKICFMEEIRSPLVAPVDREISNGLKRAVSHFTTKFGVKATQIKMPILFDANRCAISQLVSPMKTVKKLKTVVTADKGNDIDERLDLFKSLIGRSTLSHNLSLILNALKISFFYSEDNTEYYKRLLEKIRQEFHKILDDDTVLLMPTFPLTAPYHSEMVTLIPSVVYTAMFNFLEMPSTQCPLGYTAQGFPYGMQIVGRKYNDALTIACAVELEKVLGGWVPPGNL